MGQREQLEKCQSCTHCASVEKRGIPIAHYLVHCAAHDPNKTKAVWLCELQVCYSHSPKQPAREEE